MHNIENKVRLIPEKILSVEVGLGAKGGGPGNTALTLINTNLKSTQLGRESANFLNCLLNN